VTMYCLMFNPRNGAIRRTRGYDCALGTPCILFKGGGVVRCLLRQVSLISPAAIADRRASGSMVHCRRRRRFIVAAATNSCATGAISFPTRKRCSPAARPPSTRATPGWRRGIDHSRSGRCLHHLPACGGGRGERQTATPVPFQPRPKGAQRRTGTPGERPQNGRGPAPHKGRSSTRWHREAA
jgi:hypothetical protein